jgi:hypothetical protein
MTSQDTDGITRRIEQASALYHRLVIVAAPAGSGKTAILREVSDRLSTPLINVNLEVSRQMLDLTERQRILQLPRLLVEIVAASATDVALLDNIEILFDVALKQDPLRLLQGLSRNKTIVAAWSGSVADDHLVYGIPDHAEYRRYPLSEILVVTLDGIS